MAALVSSFIFDVSCSKTLLPWTIYTYTPDDDMMTVQRFFEKVVSKQPAGIQEHLSDHALDEVRVGRTKNDLDKVGNTGMEVCIHTCMYDYFGTGSHKNHELACDCSYISDFHVI